MDDGGIDELGARSGFVQNESGNVQASRSFTCQDAGRLGITGVRPALAKEKVR